MDEIVYKKLNHIKDIMEKIGPAFDECSAIGGKQMYPNINMLNLLSEAQTALEAVFFSLKREYQVMVDEKEKFPQKASYNENIPSMNSDYIR